MICGCPGWLAVMQAPLPQSSASLLQLAGKTEPASLQPAGAAARSAARVEWAELALR